MKADVEQLINELRDLKTKLLDKEDCVMIERDMSVMLLEAMIEGNRKRLKGHPKEANGVIAMDFCAEVLELAKRDVAVVLVDNIQKMLVTTLIVAMKVPDGLDGLSNLIIAALTDSVVTKSEDRPINGRGEEIVREMMG